MAMSAQQIREFVQSVGLTSAQQADLRERAWSADYWRALCPWLSIATTGERIRRSDFDLASVEAASDVAVEEYGARGYCSCENVFDLQELDQLRKAVFTVRGAGWPMIFAFVYDEFWTILHAPRLDHFLTSVIGQGYQPSARFWVNYVPPIEGGAGFLPHIDGGAGHTVTCWVPLTHATPDNGCMYVIERAAGSRDLLRDFKQIDLFTRQQMVLFTAHARALPIAPGGFLAWPQDTVHWGGIYRRGEARLALSWEFMPSTAENFDTALSAALLREHPLPVFENRLRWLCHALLRFKGRDVMMERFASLAREVSSTPPRA
jgi:hypothetical protein